MRNLPWQSMMPFSLDMPLDQKKRLVHEQRQEFFSKSLKKAILKNKTLKGKLDEIDHQDPENVNIVSRVAEINWMDGLMDRRGQLIHVFVKRFIKMVSKNHLNKGANIQLRALVPSSSSLPKIGRGVHSNTSS